LVIIIARIRLSDTVAIKATIFDSTELAITAVESVIGVVAAFILFSTRIASTRIVVIARIRPTGTNAIHAIILDCTVQTIVATSTSEIFVHATCFRTTGIGSAFVGICAFQKSSDAATIFAGIIISAKIMIVAVFCIVRVTTAVEFFAIVVSATIVIVAANRRAYTDSTTTLVGFGAFQVVVAISTIGKRGVVNVSSRTVAAIGGTLVVVVNWNRTSFTGAIVTSVVLGTWVSIVTRFTIERGTVQFAQSRDLVTRVGGTRVFVITDLILVGAISSFFIAIVRGAIITIVTLVQTNACALLARAVYIAQAIWSTSGKVGQVLEYANSIDTGDSLTRVFASSTRLSTASGIHVIFVASCSSGSSGTILRCNFQVKVQFALVAKNVGSSDAIVESRGARHLLVRILRYDLFLLGDLQFQGFDLGVNINGEAHLLVIRIVLKLCGANDYAS